MKIEVIPTKKLYEPFLELYPPVQANKMLPDWYKSQKGGNKTSMYLAHMDNEETGYTAKKCPAIQDYLSEGFIIPLWGDLAYNYKTKIDGSDESNWYFSPADATNEPLKVHLSYHTENQTEGMDIGRTSGGLTLKIGLPYRFIVPEGYSILYQDPFYHFRGGIRCLTGLVEADKWGYITFPFDLLEDRFLLEAGTPLVHCFLVKRDEDKLELNLRNGTELEYKESRETWFELHNEHSHYKNLKTVQKYNEMRKNETTAT
jgi:hypothetical protein